MLNLGNILKRILNEGVSPNVINQSIDNKERVIVHYDDGKTHHTGTRLVEPYVYGQMDGVDAVRVFDFGIDTNTESPKWKTFIVGRIQSWEPNGEHFNRPPKERGYKQAHDYNNDGDRSFDMIMNQIHFDKSTFDDTLANVRLDRENAKNKKKGLSLDDMSKTGDKNDSDFVSRVQKNLNDRYSTLNKDMGVKSGDELRQQFVPNTKLNTTLNPLSPEVRDEIRRQNKNRRNREWYRRKKDKEWMDLADQGPIRSKEWQEENPEPYNPTGPIETENTPDVNVNPEVKQK